MYVGDGYRISSPSDVLSNVQVSLNNQTNNPKAWIWLEDFRKQENAPFLIIESIKQNGNQGLFKHLLMILKDIILKSQYLAADSNSGSYAEFLLNMVINGMLRDKYDLKSVSSMLAYISITNFCTNYVFGVINYVKQILMTQTESQCYVSRFFISYLYELTVFLHIRTPSHAPIFKTLEEFSMFIIDFLFNYGLNDPTDALHSYHFMIKHDLFNNVNTDLFCNGFINQIFRLLLDHQTDIQMRSELVYKMERVVHALRRTKQVEDYGFFNEICRQIHTNILTNVQDAYFQQDFLLNLFYFSDTLSSIHEKHILNILKKSISGFQLLDLTFFQRIDAISFLSDCNETSNVSPIIRGDLYIIYLKFLCTSLLDSKSIAETLASWKILLRSFRMTSNVSPSKGEHYLANFYSCVIVKIYIDSVVNFANSQDVFESDYVCLISELHFIIKDFMMFPVTVNEIKNLYINPCIQNMTDNNGCGYKTLNYIGLVAYLFTINKQDEYDALVVNFFANRLYLLNEFSQSNFHHHTFLYLLKKRTYGIPIELLFEYFVYVLSNYIYFHVSIYKLLCDILVFIYQNKSFQVELLSQIYNFVHLSYNNNGDQQSKVNRISYKIIGSIVTIFDSRAEVESSAVNVLSLFDIHFNALESQIQDKKFRFHTLCCFKTIFRELRKRKFLNVYETVIGRFLPKVMNLLQQDIFDIDHMELFCKCVKHIIRHMGQKFSVYLREILQLIAMAFKQCPQSCFIYVCSVVFAEMNQTMFGEIQDVLKGIVGVINEEIFRNLSMVPRTTFFAKELMFIMEDYFNLQYKIVNFCPAMFFESPYVRNVCGVSLQFLCQDDDHIVRYVGTFWQKLISLKLKDTTSYGANANIIMGEFGEQIFFGIFSNLARVPRYQILEFHVEVLYKFLLVDRKLFYTVLDAVFQRIMQGTVDTKVQQFLHDLRISLASTSDESHILTQMENFVDKIRYL